jgi:hypothetical protein
MQRGGAVMSSTSHHLGSQDSEGSVASEEVAPENDELSHNVLGLIGAYRMGAALDTQDLLPNGNKRAGSVDPAPATVIAA